MAQQECKEFGKPLCPLHTSNNLPAGSSPPISLPILRTIAGLNSGIWLPFHGASSVLRSGVSTFAPGVGLSAGSMAARFLGGAFGKIGLWTTEGSRVFSGILPEICKFPCRSDLITLGRSTALMPASGLPCLRQSRLAWSRAGAALDLLISSEPVISQGAIISLPPPRYL